MNWNNGQLARHSRRSYNNDATKQKQYFAQAKRQKLTESRKRQYSAEDFIPNYLEDLPKKVHRPFHDATQARESRRKPLPLQDATATVSRGTELSRNDVRIEQSNRSSHFTELDDTSIDAKRRKLLQQSDWSGVELQKPVIIKYPETSRSARMAQCHILHHRSDSPPAFSSKNQITADTVIKIASQEYRWSPGNNSIRTWHSKGQNPMPETPIVKPKSLHDIPSSASKSFSSFLPESPCVERVLQIERAKAGRMKLQSVSHTSPSTLDEPLAKAVPATQYFHPQPIRRMPQSVYERLSNSAKNVDIAFNSDRPSAPPPQSAMAGCITATESKYGESAAPEPGKEDTSSKISESPREDKQPSIPNRLSLFEHNRVLAAAQKPSVESLPQCSDSLPSTITTPDVYMITEACHPGKRLSALPYKRPVPATELGDEDENIMWKRFVLGPSRPVLVGSAAHCSPDNLDVKKTDSRGKLGVETVAASEAPTRSASRLFENASPVPDTPRRQGPTPAPAGSAPPPTISADDPSASLSIDPQRTSDDDGAAMIPVYFREQRDSLKEMTAFPTEGAKDALLEVPQHMTSKPESARFHPPSLFVGRLADSERGDASNKAVAVAAVAPAPSASESATEQKMNSSSSNIPAHSKAPSARAMSRRRRNKRREAGRPDIRALPNIQGDPIEFTP